MRSEIWVADLARAFAALQPRTAEERAAIGRLLGFEPALAPSPAVPGSPRPESAEAGLPFPPDRRRRIPSLPLPRRTRPGGSRRDQARPVMLSPVGQDPVPAVTWMTEPLRFATSEQLRELPPYTPLLAPRSTTATLQTVLGRLVPEGPVDVSLAVDRLARLEPLTRLPRRGRRSLRFGVQVLVDWGEGMEPFRRDQVELARRVAWVTGPEQTQILYFNGSPFRGAGPGAVWTWEPYRSPPAGTRVLILSDLGISGRGRSRTADWSGLARLLAAQDCTAVALVPYPPGRWPAPHHRPFPLVPWDRKVTAAALAMRLR
jgi:hypothetical protein